MILLIWDQKTQKKIAETIVFVRFRGFWEAPKNAQTLK